MAQLGAMDLRQKIVNLHAHAGPGGGVCGTLGAAAGGGGGKPPQRDTKPGYGAAAT